MSEKIHGIDPHDLGHTIEFKVYVKILAMLIVLTGFTVWIAGFNFGSMNLVVAMLVASVKATLVALFFMHLKYENPITWLYAIFPIFFLMVMLAGVFIDNPYRGQYKGLYNPSMRFTAEDRAIVGPGVAPMHKEEPKHEDKSHSSSH